MLEYINNKKQFMKYGILTTLVVVSFFNCKGDPVFPDKIQFPRISAKYKEAEED